jgi:DNA-binding IclR family transcriptional regulator
MTRVNRHFNSVQLIIVHCPLAFFARVDNRSTHARNRDAATAVRIEEGTGAVHVNMRVGSIMSLLGTATGRVFAAFLPPKMIETFIESGVGRASVGDEAERQMTRNQVDEAVAEVREKGLARAVERPIPAVNAFSAPVFDHSGSIALVITAIGPSHTFDAD